MVNEQHAEDAEDFYFGNLPEILSERGLSCSVALIDQTNRSHRSPALTWPATVVTRILLSRVLRGHQELRLRLQGFREAWRLVLQASRAESGFRKRVMSVAARRAPSSTSMDALRLSQQISDLVARLRPKVLVVTYEGHAWERLAFAAARAVVPEMRCIGYQHAVLFRHQHALFRSLGTAFDPDSILTSGPVTRDMVARVHNFDRVEIRILGTHRRLPILARARGAPKPVCLIAPDGFATECVFLFEFGVRCALLAPDIQFALRLHPLVSFEEISDAATSQGLPENLELSELSVSEDLSRSRWALYRGSSVAIHGVLAGLRPLYVSRQDEMSMDPLYELRDWRCIIQDPDELIAQVRSDLSNDQRRLEVESRAAVEYCEKYFAPLDPAAMEAVIC